MEQEHIPHEVAQKGGAGASSSVVLQTILRKYGEHGRRLHVTSLFRGTSPQLSCALR